MTPDGRLVVLSLGAGVQSSTLAMMHKRLYEMGYGIDMGVFADTQAEPRSVYTWLDWLEKQLPYPVYRVSKGNLARDGIGLHKSKKSGKTYMKNLIPLYIQNPDGTKGHIGRKCTAEYKVREIIKAVRNKIGNKAIREWRKKYGVKSVKVEGSTKRKWIVPPGTPTLAVSLIGISTDEAERMKPSAEPWIENRWPLIDEGMSRKDCLNWMAQHDHPKPPRSACVFCPYHSDEEWLRLKNEEPEEWARAVRWEEVMQRRSLKDEAIKGKPFLHASLKPLPMVQFVQGDKNRAFGNECEGMCGM